MVKPLAIVALISGRGSNLQAIIDATGRSIPGQLCAVISNRPGAPGLARAVAAGIPVETVDHRKFSSRAAFEKELIKRIDRYDPGLVVLAGFMRVLTEGFVSHYRGRLMNIHPSLLPRFPGLDTHQRAIDAREQVHGATVHFVTDELDGGPIIIQASVPIEPDDDADTLAARVLEQEHRIYPLAVRWFAENRLEIVEKVVWLDGRPVSPREQLPAPAHDAGVDPGPCTSGQSEGG